MQQLSHLKSPCVCKRNFSWRRVLHPEPEKNDPANWVVCFGAGIGDNRWESWCKLIADGLFNSSQWGVLLVTTESPQYQYCSPIYQRFDCRDVRTLSDVSGRIGPAFGLELDEGSYPNAMVFVQNGEILSNCSLDKL